MKSLKEYIKKQINEGFKLGKNKVRKVKNYEFFPQSTKELIDIIHERLEESPNIDLNDVDVSEITNMDYLFSYTHGYSRLPKTINISEWDVTNVTSMMGMFYGCEDFNCDLSNWNVSSVIDMSYMFFNCENFNSDLSKWNVSNVEIMSHMFNDCVEFEGKGLENWDMTNVKYMEKMFGNCFKLDADLSKWNIKNAINMKNMFKRCESFNFKNLSKWNINKKCSIDGIFFGCEKYVDKDNLPDFCYDKNKKTHKPNGDKLMWYSVWEILDENGPMSKKDVLTKLGLKPTSYATAFATWNDQNIICPSKNKRGLLEAMPKEKWLKKIF